MKIYDCFTFFNEIELLELRLNLLNEIVDYFVIVEADKTYKNEEKPFNFERNSSFFKKFLNKIIYVKMYDLPDIDCSVSREVWDLEFFQRNGIMRGLDGCNREDIVIISDVDEIPNPKILQKIIYGKEAIALQFDKRMLKRIQHFFKWPKVLFRTLSAWDVLEKEPLCFQQGLYYYYLNCKSKTKWMGSTMMKYKNMIEPQHLRYGKTKTYHYFNDKKTKTPQYFRDKRTKFVKVVEENAGWHFSYLGGIDRIKLKLKSIVDGNPDLAENRYIEERINKGLDLYDRKHFEYDFILKDEIGIDNIEEFIDKYPQMYRSM